MIDALATHPRRWAAQYGLLLAGALIVIPLLAGRTPSVTGGVATGLGVGIVFWGVGILLKRQRAAAARGESDEGRTLSRAPLD